MKFNKIVCLLFLCTTLALSSRAQNAPMLTLKDAVEIALKNNYNIKLAQNNNSISKNNVTPGNAGILPTVVTGDISTNNSKQTITQTRSDGTVNNLNGIKNSNVSYGPSLNWTIFDGFAMFANYDQLKQLNQLSDVTLRDTILSTIPPM
jgi:outer membrane protein